MPVLPVLQLKTWMAAEENPAEHAALQQGRGSKAQRGGWVTPGDRAVCAAAPSALRWT